MNYFIKVPLIKDSSFSKYLFEKLEEYLTVLWKENDKMPDKLTFTGILGKEIITFIEANWKHDIFNINYENHANENLIIEYDKDIKKTREVGTETESLDGKIIDGIISPEAAKKIVSFKATPAYSIERNINPSIRIRLVR